MKLKRVSKLIEKINVLHDSLLSIDDEISPIERDLLLNYIRQLYEEVLEIETEDKSAKEKAPIKISRPPIETFRSVVEPVNIPKQEPEPKPAEEIGITKISAEHIVDTSEKNGQVEAAESPKEKVLVKTKSEVAEVKQKDVNEVNNQLAEIFEIKEARELSEKLSSQPIADLNNAMGINDRFLTVNELFGGNNDAFSTCINHLNQLSSYDEAKSYLLSNVAETNDWSAPERIKKAASFINLVQRRYK